MWNYRYVTKKYNIQRHIENFKFIRKSCEDLKTEDKSTIVDVINSLADFICDNSYFYEGEDFFSAMADEVVRIIEIFNHSSEKDISINKLLLIMNGFCCELDKIPVNIFFYGKDKYHILKSSSKVKMKNITDMDGHIKSYKKDHESSIDVLIISEETTNIEVDFSPYFSDVIYYDKLMNLLFSISEKLYYGRYDYNYLLKSMEQARRCDIETIVVGNSYPLTGIDTKVFKGKTVSLALSSQDLYYSYKLAASAIKNNSNIKKCIIGAGYYLVNHDLSKSKNEDAIRRVKDVYYPILGDKHNSRAVEEPEKITVTETLNDNVISFIFSLNFLEDYFKELIYRSNDKYFNSYITREMNSIMKDIKLSDVNEDEKWRLGRWRAEQHNKLSKYTETPKEYEEVFNEFIDFLKENKVEPIIVVFPNTKYYNKFLNENYEKEFYSIISRKQNHCELRVIDFSKDSMFLEEDFIDFDHMNQKGAEKLTMELNKLLYA